MKKSPILRKNAYSSDERVILAVAGYPRLLINGVQVDLATRYDVALLLYLALCPQQHSRSVLGRLLWPHETVANGRANLRSCLYRLRPLLQRWLRIDRDMIALVPDQYFDIDRSGTGAIGGGLLISPDYQQWLSGVATVYPISIPHWWLDNPGAVVEPMVDFCRNNLLPLITQGKGAHLFENNYDRIAQAALNVTDPTRQILLGNALHSYTRLTHCRIPDTAGIIRRMVPLDETVAIGQAMTLAALAHQYRIVVDADRIRSVEEQQAKSPPAPAMLHAAAMYRTATERTYAVAAEHAQIAVAHCLAVRAPSTLHYVIDAAATCALANQRVAARGYVALARKIAIDTDARYKYFQIDAIAKALDDPLTT